MKAGIQIDPALVGRCRRGSTEAFAELVEQLKRPAYFHALSLTGNREDALDVSQDAFVRALRNIRSVDADRPLIFAAGQPAAVSVMEDGMCRMPEPEPQCPG